MMKSGDLQSRSLGHSFENSDVTVFFGNRHSLREKLALEFPEYRLLGIRQTHSDVVIESPYVEPGPEADAHFTRERKLALCVRTADCMPVLIHDAENQFIAAIHAGWRGIENEIILKTAARLVASGAALGSARAWIGPHIGADSFEVGLDVAMKLQARFDAVRGYSGESTSLREHPDASKKRVDLLEIARAQLRSVGIEPDRTTELAIDTYTSADHESFRRDRDKSGRQTSFIALK